MLGENIGACAAWKLDGQHCTWKLGWAKAAEAMRKMQTMMMEAAREVRAHVEANFDYVGDAFAREARDIHEGRSEKREIYGEATPADVRKLKDDGVPVSALPDAPPDPSKVN